MRSLQLAALALLLLTTARADEVLLKSGGAVRGKVLSEDEKEVVVQTDAGKVKIPREKIEKVTKSSGRGAAPADPAPEKEDDGPPRTDRRVLLFAFDGVDGSLLEELAQRVQRSTGLGVELLKTRPKPVEKFVDRRASFIPEVARRMGIPLEGSLDELEAAVRKRLEADTGPNKETALALLEDLKLPRHSAPALAGQVAKVTEQRLEREGALAAIGLFGKDMCTSEANVLFGFAGSDTSAGVVSIGRFAANDAPRDLLVKRTVVQLVSNACALLGLEACKETACARYNTTSLEALDKKPETLCRACKAKLEAALKAKR